MITVTKADAAVIKSSTILSAYVISGGLDVMPRRELALAEDMKTLSQLEESELVFASIRLVRSAMAYNLVPNPLTHAQAKKALTRVSDMFMQTKEV